MLNDISEKDLDFKGCFKCPQCGNEICPDDFSNSSYLIEGVNVTHKNVVILIHCKCGNRLLLKLPIPNICVYEGTLVTRYELFFVKITEIPKNGKTEPLH